jgi:tetratricopeptide (TPR) repeat protein
MRHGKMRQAVDAAAKALPAAGSPEQRTAAHEMLAEVHFRIAMDTSGLETRLQALDEALRHTPDAPRLRFHRAITLLRSGRLSEALADLDIVAAREPQRKGLPYIHQLARLANGLPWQPQGISPAQANTLRLVEGLLHSRPRSTPPLTIEPPLLGRSLEMWSALAAMQSDATATPVSLFKIACDCDSRKSISRTLYYYRGVAALRQSDLPLARIAWSSAQAAGFVMPWLDHNLVGVQRQQAIASVGAGQWDKVVDLASHISSDSEDKVLAETVGIAYYHLGYDAAQAGQWSKAVQQWRKAAEHVSSRYLAQNMALAEEALGHWAEAAQAWREMVRRRPRREDHPDYLTDAQIAALWSHVADCYERDGDDDEVITSLKNAVKYKPDDAALQTRLGDHLMSLGRQQTAENALNAALEADPQNVDALMRLADLYASSWHRDPRPFWRRILAIRPTHAEVRDAMAEYYVRNTRLAFVFGTEGSEAWQRQIKHLEEGLRDLPDHPKILASLGTACVRVNDKPRARECLLRASQLAPQDVGIAFEVLHELLHLSDSNDIKEVLQRVHQIPNLLPAFWLDEARSALHCKLTLGWIMRFFDEAIALITVRPELEETPASILVQAFEITHKEHNTDLLKQIEARIRSEAAETGAVEYIEAYQAHLDPKTGRKPADLLRKAQQAAHKVRDKGMEKMIKAFQDRLDGPQFGWPSFLNGFSSGFPNVLADLFDSEDEKDEEGGNEFF